MTVDCRLKLITMSDVSLYWQANILITGILLVKLVSKWRHIKDFVRCVSPISVALSDV